MKNWEFYEEEIKKYGFYFAMVNNKVSRCSITICSQCAFYTECGRNNKNRMKWLYQEHKEPIVLTDDEKSLCKLLGKGWIARDVNDTLRWYENKPKQKFNNNWCIPDSSAFIEISICCPQCKFDFIKWEDEEPWKVKVDDEL